MNKFDVWKHTRFEQLCARTQVHKRIINKWELNPSLFNGLYRDRCTNGANDAEWPQASVTLTDPLCADA